MEPGSQGSEPTTPGRVDNTLRKTPQVTIGAPCLRLHELLEEMIASAETGSLVPEKYIIVDNGGGLQRRIDSGKSTLPLHKTLIIWEGRHVGVAGAWNRVFSLANDYIIITNDDVKFHFKTIEHLVQAAESTPSADFFCPRHTSGSKFCVFLLRRKAWLQLGPFDESFHPAYFEDNDYSRRMEIAEITGYELPLTSYDHVGSATLKDFTPSEQQVHHEQFRRNREHYCRKWGGEPGNETLMIPALPTLPSSNNL